MSRKKKTLLVGFDAACWEYLDPLLAKGELPALKQLMEEGMSGVLQSTMPALTPVAWSSIITGKNPGKHGVFDMIYRRPGSDDFLPVNAHRRWGTPFWERLNAHGIRVGLVNIPFTYPPEPMEGFIVGGFGTPTAVPDVTYPAEALSWIEARNGSYSPTVPASVLRSGQYEAIYEAERALQSYQVNVAVELADLYQVDVLAINLMILDHINHKMPDMSYVEQAICQLDADLQSLMARFQPDNVMIISDHGARRVKGDFLLHAWLQDQGYLQRMKRPLSEQSLALNWALKQWLQNHKGWSGSWERYFRRLLKELILNLPAKLADNFWQRLEKQVPFAKNHVYFGDQLDYEKTQVITGGSYSSVLYFNQANRGRKGLVSLEENDELASELIEKLMRLADPDTKEPLFSSVHKASDLYQGALSDFSPDLVIDSYTSSWNILTTLRRGAYAEAVRENYFVQNVKDFGHHSRDGIVVCAGKDFASGQQGCDGHLMDIPATLLHLYNVPVPDDYDGRSLTTLFDPNFLLAYPAQSQPGDEEVDMDSINVYTDIETEEIVEHLRALGYLD